MLTRFKNLKVLVATPSTGFWYAKFGQSLINMTVAFMNHRVEDYKTQQLEYIFTKGSMLPFMRCEAVRAALLMEATHLLWIDSDHVFPKRLLHKLIHDDKDVVGINHVSKRIPAQPTARGFPTKEHPRGTIIYTDEDNKSLEKVWRFGTGTMLVKMEVYKKIGYKCFDMTFREDADQYQGEDWTMVEHMEAAGIELWIDHDLSWECKHIGEMEFGHDMVGEVVTEPLVDTPKNPVLAKALGDAFKETQSGLIVPANV